MLAPESLFLRVAEPRVTLRKSLKADAWRKTVNNFVAATEISVIIPNTIVLPKVNSIATFAAMNNIATNAI
jgi:hypothetical protein